jgi:F420-0:gamma-glutamyl ligase
MDTQLGIQTTANPDRTIDIELDGKTYHRYPVKTRLVNLGDDYMQLVETYVKPHFQVGDFIAISEKVISICQKRVIHESEVHPSWLAKLICKFVTKYPDDVGFENPRKMQVAINEAGYFRMVLAVIGGGVMKYVFRQPGWFYRIAGNDINAIDGFNPIAIPPFNQYAMLAPANSDGVCNEIEEKFGIPATIVDANNVNTEILGRSGGIIKMNYDNLQLRRVLAGNPMGQEDEHTPFLIVRSV